MFVTFDVVAVSDIGNQLFGRRVAVVHVSGGHADDGFVVAVDCARVAGQLFVECRRRSCAVQSARQYALVYQICIRRGCAFVVVGYVAASGVNAAFAYGKQRTCHALADLPFLCHGFVAQHKVAFRLVSETFVRKHARYLRCKYNRVTARHNCFCVFDVVFALGNEVGKLLVCVAEFGKVGLCVAKLFLQGFVVVSKSHAVRFARGLEVVCDVRALAGVEFVQRIAVDVTRVFKPRQVGFEFCRRFGDKFQFVGKGYVAHAVCSKVQFYVLVYLVTRDNGVAVDVSVGRGVFVQPVEGILQVVDVNGAGVVPHFTVKHANKCLDFRRFLGFGKLVVAYKYVGGEAVLYPDVGVETFLEFVHGVSSLLSKIIHYDCIFVQGFFCHHYFF